MVPLHPYFSIKDVFGFIPFFVVFLGLAILSPKLFIHPENYIMATPLVTPSHIVPEWYFLPFYAILRSIPSKLGGVILMFGAIAVGFVLPLVNPTPSSSFASVFRKPMVFLVGNVIVLGGLGAAPLATPLILAVAASISMQIRTRIVIPGSNCSGILGCISSFTGIR